MEVRIILLAIGGLVTVTEKLVKGLGNFEIRDLVKMIKSTEFLEESWRLKESYCDSYSCNRPSAKAHVKNSQDVK